MQALQKLEEDKIFNRQKMEKLEQNLKNNHKEF